MRMSIKYLKDRPLAYSELKDTTPLAYSEDGVQSFSTMQPNIRSEALFTSQTATMLALLLL